MRRLMIFALCAGMICSSDFTIAEYNVATKKNEWIMIGTDKEVRMGASMAKKVEKHFGVVKDDRLIKRVNDIGQKIAKVCDRTDLNYRFRILKSDKVNAVALPGGYVYVFEGLLDEIDTDDELACVIAHEVGHVVAKHSVKRMQAMMGYTLLKIATVLQPQPTDRNFHKAVDLAAASIFTEYSREDEFEADELGVKYAEEAGYDPNGMISFLEKMKEVMAKEPTRPYSYWRTHPYMDDRIRQVRLTVTGNITFDDYINKVDERMS